jgi:hypothetical protein
VSTTGRTIESGIEPEPNTLARIPQGRIALELRRMPALMRDNDVVTVSRHRESGITIDLPGQYWLWNSRDVAAEPKRFACRAISISPHVVALVAPVRGSVGEWVSADIEHFGRLDGRIGRPLDHRGFVMQILASADERGRLAAKIEWYEKYKDRKVADRRRHPRLVVEYRFSTLLLADGAVMSCLVTDFSAGGVSVLAGIAPEIGSVLAIGKVIGRVNRHFSGGFAANFVNAQESQTVEQLIFCTL